MSTIREEIKQARPFRSTAHEAAVSLVRTASAVVHQFDRLVQRDGITYQQYNVLRILRGAGGPLPTMEIGDRLVQQTPGVSRLLDRLEKRRLIRRTRSRDDRRQVLCALTPSGRRLLGRLDRPVDAFDTESMSPLTSREQTRLIDLLQRIRSGLGGAAGDE